MDKRFWISGLVLTIASLLLGFVIHGLLLSPDYHALGPIMRTDEDSSHYLFPWMILSDVAYGFGITWIYRQGWTPGRSAIAQGLRCGFAVALVATIPMFLIYYAVEPMPGMLVAKQEALALVQMLLLGVLAALLNPSPGAR
ncbi:MAG TPA: hypothetical protein VK753_08860 [Xanthomonadaceae bacterium]|jgi:hypothetical protein|nr:hypothetical protein [Xanthomonadaceae bacterium]